MGKYADNAYYWMKRNGHAPKYEHAGIYCIKVDDKIVYIGKSGNMLRRIAFHYAHTKMETEAKYRILSEARRKGHELGFDVLYYAKSKRYEDKQTELGEKEGEYIRQYRPILNTQIPKEEDWRKWDTNPLDAKKILQEILEK